MLNVYSPLDRGDTSIHEAKTGDGLSFRIVRNEEGDALIQLGIVGHCCIPKDQIRSTINALKEVQKANGDNV